MIKSSLPTISPSAFVVDQIVHELEEAIEDRCPQDITRLSRALAAVLEAGFEFSRHGTA